jgi:hypothetical protein
MEAAKKMADTVIETIAFEAKKIPHLSMSNEPWRRSTATPSP